MQIAKLEQARQSSQAQSEECAAKLRSLESAHQQHLSDCSARQAAAAEREAALEQQCRQARNEASIARCGLDPLLMTPLTHCSKVCHTQERLAPALWVKYFSKRHAWTPWRVHSYNQVSMLVRDPAKNAWLWAYHRHSVSRISCECRIISEIVASGLRRRPTGRRQLRPRRGAKGWKKTYQGQKRVRTRRGNTPESWSASWRRPRVSEGRREKNTCPSCGVLRVCSLTRKLPDLACRCLAQNP